MFKKDDIRFRSENGLCPYFINHNQKYYIKDVKISGKWYYRLEVRELNTEQTLFFASPEEAQKYILEKLTGKRYDSQKFNEFSVYITCNYIYIQSTATVTIRKTADVLTGEFETYLECLNYAKDYIHNIQNTQTILFE